MRRGPKESFMEEGNFKLGFENGVGFQQVKTGEGHHMLKKMSGELRRRKYMVKGEKRVRQGPEHTEGSVVLLRKPLNASPTIKTHRRLLNRAINFISFCRYLPTVAYYVLLIFHTVHLQRNCHDITSVWRPSLTMLKSCFPLPT